MNFDDIMLDLETLDTGPDAAIVSIGAVAFNREGLGPAFYVVANLDSTLKSGATISAGTVQWWMQQSDEARKVFAPHSYAVSLAVALSLFQTWLFAMPRGADAPGPKDPAQRFRIWGNGASFDNVLLRRSYERLSMAPPWAFWNDRCYRTLKGLRPDIKLARTGTHHNALDDARSQAEHAVAILRAAFPVTTG